MQMKLSKLRAIDLGNSFEYLGGNELESKDCYYLIMGKWPALQKLSLCMDYEYAEMNNITFTGC